MIDSKTLFTSASGQTITASGASTNVLDLTGGLQKDAWGSSLSSNRNSAEVWVNVVISAATGTSPTLAIALQDSADNSSFSDKLSIPTFTPAANQRFSFACVRDIRRYVRLYYTVGGTATITLTAWVSDAPADFTN